MLLRLAFLGGTLLALTGTVWAQDPQQQPGDQPQADPPSRVARLNFLNGNVSFRPGNVEDWGAATLNYPLTTGDHLWTDEQAGVEMHVGSAALRLAGATSFAVLNIDDRTTQVSIAQGFMNVRVRHLEDGETFEVDTPNGAIALLRAGDYRIGVDPESNATMVFVRSGGVEVSGGDKRFPVDENQQVKFVGTDQVDAESLEPPTPDQWDEWCAGRDQQDERNDQAVEQYVGKEMIGSEDLAANGEWHSDAAYGNYWVPTRVEAGWAPYRYGHWAYVAPWGWTWIDDASWGFAPFHYGRWAMIGGAWGWVPGAVVVRPVYAPALVAFVGGERFGATIGIGGVGFAAWVPLGPREVYRPYYRVSDRYITRVNVTPVTNINVTNVNYVNRTYVTAVRQETFVGARPVASGYVRVPPNAMARAERVDMASARPGREAYLGRPAGGMRVATPPRAVVNRPVIVRSAPPDRGRSSDPVRVARPTTLVRPTAINAPHRESVPNSQRPPIDTRTRRTDSPITQRPPERHVERPVQQPHTQPEIVRRPETTRPVTPTPHTVDRPTQQPPVQQQAKPKPEHATHPAHKTTTEEKKKN